MMTPDRPRSVDAVRPFVAQIEEHVLALAGVGTKVHGGRATLRTVSLSAHGAGGADERPGKKIQKLV